MRAWFFLAVLSACGFRVDAATGDDGGALDPGGGGGGGGGGGSGSDSTPRDVPHVDAAHEAAGTADWVISGTVRIDTGAKSITPAPPSGVIAESVAQDPSGPELFVIRARSVTLGAGSTLQIAGTRPFVLLADTIAITGRIEARARGATPGPGGRLPGQTAAMAGSHNGTYHDSGGGGGGFGSNGAAGGVAGLGCTSPAPGGVAGGMFGMSSLATLEGGGGGGTGSKGSCTLASGGGGGGAIQLSALTRIDLDPAAVIEVGGGGGTGGVYCGNDDAGAGGGGGGGGAIFLDAPTIALGGRLAANGGGGGGGGCGPGGSGGNGGDGKDTAALALGGGPGGGCGTNGGAGAFAASAAVAGTSQSCDGNSGGGGGAIGRIVIHAAATTNSVVSSPTATVVTF